MLYLTLASSSSPPSSSYPECSDHLAVSLLLSDNTSNTLLLFFSKQLHGGTFHTFFFQVIVKHTGQQEASITLSMFQAAFGFCFINGIAAVTGAS